MFVTCFNLLTFNYNFFLICQKHTIKLIYSYKTFVLKANKKLCRRRRNKFACSREYDLKLQCFARAGLKNIIVRENGIKNDNTLRERE